MPPTGLPPNISKIILSNLDAWSNKIKDGIDYLAIPSYSELHASTKLALSDSIRAIKSISNLGFLLFRPLFIFALVFFQHLYSISKIVAEHTIQHGIIALREATRQCYVAGVWFVMFQKSLSSKVIYMEIGLVFLLIVLYAVRRYIRKKKYVERILKWYRAKKNHIQKKYNDLVHKVAETSLVLALLLPHVLYIAAIGGIKYWVPSVLKYFATQTILSSVVSFWYPLYRTLKVITQWRRRQIGIMNDTDKAKSELSSNATATTTNSSTNSKIKTIAKKGVETKTNDTSTRKISTNEEDFLFKEVDELLMHWVILTLLCTCGTLIRLLPIISSIITLSPPIGGEKKIFSLHYPSRWGIYHRGRKAFSFLAYFQLTNQTMEEIKLLFYLWLKVLPIDSMGTSTTSSSPVGKKRSVGMSSPVEIRKRMDYSATSGASRSKHTSNVPIVIVYNRLAFIAVSVTNSLYDTSQNSVLVKDTDDDSKQDNVKRSIMQKLVRSLRSVLDVLVWGKVISSRTKNRIITTILECVGLYPALPTLFMPGYFTNYGIVYVSSIVPAAQSARAHDDLRQQLEKFDGCDSNTVSVSIRWLQYWVIHSILSTVIVSFAPLLAWIPLSTHITLLLWSYIQLEAVTHHLYDLFEWELMLFGFIHRYRHNDDNASSHENWDFDRSIVIRCTKPILHKALKIYGAKSENKEDSTSSGKVHSDTELSDPNLPITS